MEKIIKVSSKNAWAMEKDGMVYYVNEVFFGIQEYKINPPELGGGPHQFIEQIISSVEPPADDWYEIAQQLYAMKEGWV